jgi:acetoin utilization deacetylase AcuC-like enzyme
MNRTALIYHKDYLLHDAGETHVERPERLKATMDYFRKKGALEKALILEPFPCIEEDILRVHTKEHLEHIKNLSISGGGYADDDTYCSPATYAVARLAAGGCIRAAKAVIDKDADNAFALIRPPGHHASRNKAAGFCFFNNAAITARYLQEVCGLKRILIFDWDAHAGNGTMDIFYDDPSVLDISIHQDPRNFYPHTGLIEQMGRFRGEGFTVNIPVPEGSHDADYIHILKEFVLPAMRAYCPEFVIVSAGQDSHGDDSISGISLTENGFGEMTRLIVDESNRVCGGRVVVLLEGGYELASFARSNYAILCALMGVYDGYEIKGEIKESTDVVLSELRERFLPCSFTHKAP